MTNATTTEEMTSETIGHRQTRTRQVDATSPHFGGQPLLCLPLSCARRKRTVTAGDNNPCQRNIRLLGVVVTLLVVYVVQQQQHTLLGGVSAFTITTPLSPSKPLRYQKSPGTESLRPTRPSSSPRTLSSTIHGGVVCPSTNSCTALYGFRSTIRRRWSDLVGKRKRREDPTTTTSVIDNDVQITVDHESMHDCIVRRASDDDVSIDMPSTIASSEVSTNHEATHISATATVVNKDSSVVVDSSSDNRNDETTTTETTKVSDYHTGSDCGDSENDYATDLTRTMMIVSKSVKKTPSSAMTENLNDVDNSPKVEDTASETTTMTTAFSADIPDTSTSSHSELVAPSSSSVTPAISFVNNSAPSPMTSSWSSTAVLEKVDVTTGPTTTMATTVVAPEYVSERLYDLPPIEDGRKLTKLEREYRDMLGTFTTYSERDILSLRDPRMRSLFRGVAAAAQAPVLYRAFEVLYEDLLPLRLAGRLIFKKLKELLKESKEERQRDIDSIVSQTSLDSVEVEEARLAFVSVAVELNGDAFLTVSQLCNTPGLQDVATTLGYEDTRDMLDFITDQGDDVSENAKEKKVAFTDLVLGLNACVEQVCAIEACNPAAVMHLVMHELKEQPPVHNFRLDAKRKKFEERYDEMVAAFKGWEGLVPDEGTGRIMDVVRGCFEGAKNEPVVYALRIVYVDYSPLRMAGDIIFKLVKSVMDSRIKQRK